MNLTLGQAAKAVGKSKPTLARAIKRGVISASRADDGSYQIDASELHRAFPPVTRASDALPDLTRSVPASAQDETPVLRREVELLREVVADLRARLDAEAAERRRLTLVLTGPPGARGAWSWWPRRRRKVSAAD